MGHFNARQVVVSISSAMPSASFAMTLAVAGATTHISAFFASEICSTSHCLSVSNISTTTLLADKVSKLKGETNSVAWLVIMTSTPAPSFFNLDTISHDL